MKNCPNCGSPLEVGEIKCKYCGTPYLDLTGIDFTSNEPIFLTLKTPAGTITQRCYPCLDSIDFTQDTAEITGYNNEVIKKVVVSNHIQTNVSFKAIAMPGGDNVLCNIIRS